MENRTQNLAIKGGILGFISGVFFSGPPYDTLKAWHDGKVQLVVSKEILDEYKRVGKTLAEKFPGVDASPILDLLTINTEVTIAPSLPESVCDDTEDDKFMACALAGKVKYIISGDKHLLKIFMITFRVGAFDSCYPFCVIPTFKEF